MSFWLAKIYLKKQLNKKQNIIQITKDNKNKQKYLKKIIKLTLIVMLVVFIFITSIFIYKKLTQPQNYIEPYLEKSTSNANGKYAF